jgi:RNAse (barnase) inhibitor barstar
MWPRERGLTEIVLDGAAWQTADDFYDALLPALGAPPWHGHNLDALNDSIAHGGINSVNTPMRLSIRGVGAMGLEAAATVDRFAALIGAMKVQGVAVDLILQPHI